MSEDEQMKLIGEITKPIDKIKIGNYLKGLAKNKEQTELAALAEANQKADEAAALKIANVKRKEAERSAAIKEGKEADEAAALKTEAIEKVKVLDTEILATMLRIVQKGGSLRKEDEP
jgi:hypothetical protein